MKKIAIVGAGLSGLVLARQLRDVTDVTLFEKSRGVGGRMATRYADDYEFDHGAQFFTARTRAFREFLRPLINDGIVANWRARFAQVTRHETQEVRDWGDDRPHFVGTPRMNAVGKYLSQGIEVQTKTQVVQIMREDGQWFLTDDAGTRHGGFDWLVLTAPAPQTAKLAERFPGLTDICVQHDMRACFALMLGFARPLDLPWQAALVRDADISWISVNSSKPGRSSPFTLLVHSTNDWANAHLEDPTESVCEHMLDEASAVTGLDLRVAEYHHVHRWRYANIDRQGGPRFYIDNQEQLAACGDWFVRGRIEAAFNSACALARQLRLRL